MIGLIVRPGGESAIDALTRLVSMNVRAEALIQGEQASSRSICQRLALITPSDESSARPHLHLLDSPDARLVLLSDAKPVRRENDQVKKLGPDSPLDWDLPGRWTSIYVPSCDTEPIHWGSDALGAQWLYFTDTVAGTIFSTDFRLACLFAGSAKVASSRVLRSALVLGYNLGQETLHPAVSLAPPGCVFEWKCGEFQILRTHRIEYGDSFSGASKAAKTSAVISAFESAAQDWRDSLPTRTAISLSAGLDSRTALGFLTGAGIALNTTLTFGNPESTEVKQASQIAKIRMSKSEIFPVPAISWEDWQSNIQQLGAPGQVQRCGWAKAWLRTLQSKADAIVHGYLGDALTGKHLIGPSSQNPDWIANWTSWSIDEHWHSWPGLHEHSRKMLKDELGYEFQEQLVGINAAFPHQQALHLDLYCRQRRWVASQANELARVGLPVCFFYHPAIFNVWANMPFKDLHRQELYLHANELAHPDLFPTSRASIQDTVKQLGAKLNRTIIQALKGGNKQPIPPRVIERYRILLELQKDCIHQVQIMGDVLNTVVDVVYVLETLKNIDTRRPSESECAALIRVVNTSHLLALNESPQTMISETSIL